MQQLQCVLAGWAHGACHTQVPVGVSAGNRRLLLQVNSASIETQYQFNAYNDFASLDFRVTFNVRLP